MFETQSVDANFLLSFLFQVTKDERSDSEESDDDADTEASKTK